MGFFDRLFRPSGPVSPEQYYGGGVQEIRRCGSSESQEYSFSINIPRKWRQRKGRNEPWSVVDFSDSLMSMSIGVRSPLMFPERAWEANATREKYYLGTFDLGTKEEVKKMKIVPSVTNRVELRFLEISGSLIGNDRLGGVVSHYQSNLEYVIFWRSYVGCDTPTQSVLESFVVL